MTPPGPKPPNREGGPRQPGAARPVAAKAATPSAPGAAAKAAAPAKSASAKPTPARAAGKADPRADAKAAAPARTAASKAPVPARAAGSKAAPARAATASKAATSRPGAPRPAAAVAAPRRTAPRRTLPTPPRALSFVSPVIWDRLREYAVLTRQDRPVGWLLLLWPTYWGLWLAAEGFPPWGTLAIFTIGVLVMRSAGCAINDWADRWLDPQVQRTRERPLAAGRVSPREALAVFGVLLAIALCLVLLTNAKTIALAGVAALLAVVYPFLKRHTYVPQVWLGAAFGMSIPMAWSAVTGAWPAPVAWLAFAANILWATAYDTYYAMVDRDDDLRAGAKSTAILFGDLDLVAVGIIQGSFLLAMALLGGRAELGTAYYAGLALAVAVSAWQLWRARKRDREGCFAAFRASHLAGLALFAGIAADYALR
jgi:4-hydroxybenzoate polyprenyltransferase